jgi:hypothetical protein
MAKVIQMTMFVYALWAAVTVGSDVADWATRHFASAEVRINAAMK